MVMRVGWQRLVSPGLHRVVSPGRDICTLFLLGLQPAGACIQQYHQQLSYCITQYLEKDPKLADVILRGLIK